mmetsp:Transcript_1286/g.5154  ORF Transcript_1286/g.5154 Transcript_1286/m.5154 type:complete len:205 (+) Transcript_1286:468-1082(+)
MSPLCTRVRSTLPPLVCGVVSSKSSCVGYEKRWSCCDLAPPLRPADGRMQLRYAERRASSSERCELPLPPPPAPASPPPSSRSPICRPMSARIASVRFRRDFSRGACERFLLTAPLVSPLPSSKYRPRRPSIACSHSPRVGRTKSPLLLPPAAAVSGVVPRFCARSLLRPCARSRSPSAAAAANAPSACFAAALASRRYASHWA